MKQADIAVQKYSFLRDWGWANFFYLLPASFLVPIGGFLQPSTGGMGLDEIWISVIFYGNLLFLILMGLRYWALKRKSSDNFVFSVPLSFASGVVFYLFPSAILISLILVGTQGEQLLKIPQNPGILASIPFLTLCFFFAFPILWVGSICLSWLVCWGWRTWRHFAQKLGEENLKNTRKSTFKDPILASWAAVNIFYLLPASLALPFLVFTHSQDPDALFVLLMAWALLLLIGNILGILSAFLRYVLLKKRLQTDFQKIVLSPLQSNALYIMPLVLAGSIEAGLTSWGKALLQMDFETFLSELPWYVCFFTLDFLGFWVLATLFSWFTRALATIFWQPDPRPSVLKGKKKVIQREMPAFLIHLPKSLTGNLLEEMEEEPKKTQEASQELARENRPAAGPLFLYHWLVPERLKGLAYAFFKEMAFYILPLALAWGIGAVFILEVGNWQDLFQLVLWASGIAFLLGLVVQVYDFLLACLVRGISYVLKKQPLKKKKFFIFSFIQNIFRYLLPAPLLIGFLATIPDFFTPKPIAVRSALFGALGIIGMAIALSLCFQLFFVIFRSLLRHFFGKSFELYAQKLRRRKTEKQALKQTSYRWHAHKYRFQLSQAADKVEEMPSRKPIKKRKISKILTHDGRIIRIKPNSRAKGKP